MLNRTGIFTETAAAPVQILYNVQNQVSVSILVDGSTTSVTEDGRKIVKAGTPLAGDLADRSTAFKAGDTPTGVLLHDVDITDGTANGTLLIWGFVNLDRLDSATQTLATAAKTALDGKIYLLRD
jgi:hypothetical protein